MRKIFGSLALIIIAIITLFLLTGCKSETEEEILKDKTLAELNYIEVNIFGVVKKYLNGNYLVDNQTDWDTITNDYNKILNSSSLIILDLTSLQIQNNKVLEFENKLNNISFTIQNKTEMAFLGALKDFYSLIPDYLEDFYANKGICLEKRMNLNLMECMYSCMLEDFELSQKYIDEAENACQKLMDDIEYLNDNKYEMSKKYIEIQEIKKLIQNRSKESIINKYTNLI